MIKKVLFLLVFVPVFGLAQFTQNFDGGTSLPSGWIALNGGDVNTWGIVDYTGSTGLTAKSGTKTASIAYGSTAHNDYLVTPAITVTAGVSDFMSFWGRSRDPLYPEVISVKVSTTTATAAAFTNVLAATVAPPSGAAFYKYHYDLTDYVGQTIYIGFHSQTTDKFYFDIDDVVVSAIPACVPPSGITASGITQQTADILCTSPSSSFQVQYGLSGFALGSGTITPTISGTSTTLQGLSASSVYQYYVRTDCGGSNYSEWYGPYNFATLCAVVSAFPFTQGFDTATIPNCWTNEAVSGTANWTFVTANGNSTITPRTGPRMAEFRTTTIGNKTKLVTPPMDLTLITNPQLQFYYANVNWAGDIDQLRVFYKTSAASPWVQIGSDYVGENTEWASVTLALPNPSATYYIAFEATSNWARGLNLDDITVSGTLSNDDFKANSLKVYPNPTKDWLNISFDALVSKVEIYNLLGQKVLEANFNSNDASVDMSALNAGTYTAKVYSDELVKTVKVIKK